MSPSNSLFKFIVFITLILSVLSLTNCSGSHSNQKAKDTVNLIEIRGRTMGTTYMVKTVSIQEKDTNAELKAGIDELLKDINMKMSTYIKESEISRFNNDKGTQWFTVSTDTAHVFAEADRISKLSNGAFDITLGPLINLWGFGAKKKGQEIPPDQEIEQILLQIGYKKLSVRLSPPALKKETPTLYCSLSAIAKGFGVDKVAEFLEQLGHNNYMVEIGGEVRTLGSKPNNQPWRVAIATPDGSSRFQKVMALNNMAMATSGDYHNYFEKDGVRYSHTIDPTTGKPITHTLASITVLHKSCMTADAVATAIDVMGPEKGFELALKEDLAIFMIIRQNGTFIEKMSPRFQTIINEEIL
jgi:FAD:protein FMN transferase